MIFNNPTSQQFESFDNWSDVATAVNQGAVLIHEGTILDLPHVMTIARQSALQLIADKHAEMLTAATGGATSAERDTWVVKESAARDIIAGGTDSGVLVPVGGETLEQLAHKILTKAQAYKQLVGIADHIKRTAEKSVESLTLDTLDDLAALDAALDAAKAMADGALQQIAAQ